MTDSPTPPQVAQHATTTARLARFALIGVMGTETEPAALIRTPEGEITRVTPGDAVAGQKVEAIGADRVILSGGARRRTLTLPKT